MNWITFSYSLSAKPSSPRVSLWRQLNRLGAITPVGGVYLLPDRDRCVEAFSWLVQQVHQAGGEALMMHVDQLEGMTDQDVIARFREVRQADYAALDEQVEHLETEVLRAADTPTALQEIKSELDRMQQVLADITDIDYFVCPERDLLSARLARVRLAIFPEVRDPVEIARDQVEAYRGVLWVTRPHPHVDRLACVWLIRRFIDPDAIIRYVPGTQDGDTNQRDEVPFDVPGAAFSHRGSLCTFEVMLRTFGLASPALQVLAEIVHEIDVRDGVSARPEIGGVDALLRGWQLTGIADTEMERRGLDLFEGLYAALSDHTSSSCESGGNPT